LLAVLHIVEQLIFGMQDLYALQRMTSIYESWFASTTPAMAVLFTIVMALAVLGVRCIINGGFARFISMFLLGLPTLGELHHVIETLRALHYTSGTVAAVPSIICGVLFLRALLQEHRPSKTTAVAASLQLHVAA